MLCASISTAVALSLLLTACGSSPQRNAVKHKVRKEDKNRVPFKESDLKQGPGKTMLVGRAWLNDATQSGQRTGANIDIILNPVTPTSTQWFNEVCRQGKVLNKSTDSRYKAHIHTSRTNQFGQYVFMDVPVGEYYLVARMYWMDEKPYSGPVQYGGLLAKKVQLGSTTNTVNLDDGDACRPYFN